MSLRIEAYRAALVLNNRGIDQINIRCFDQASESFRGALSLINSTIIDVDETQTIPGGCMSAEILMTTGKEVFCRRKIFDLLSSNSSKNNPTKFYPVFQGTDDYMRVVMINDDKFVSLELVDAAFSSPSSSDICFIRIDDMGGQSDPEDGSLERDKAILLYNIGSFYYMNGMSLRNKGKNKKSNQQFSQSLKAYQSSLKLISCLKEQQPKNETWLDLLCMILLQRLSYVTSAVGSATLTRLYYALLGELRSILSTDPLVMNLQFRRSDCICAAAA